MLKEGWRSIYPGVGKHVLVDPGSVSLSKSLFERLELSLIISSATVFCGSLRYGAFRCV
jgi:hypothetical protein